MVTLAMARSDQENQARGDLTAAPGWGHRVGGRHDVEPTAFFIHGAMHRSKPSAKCVMHTHMPFATTLTVVHGGRLEWASQNSLKFPRRVASFYAHKQGAVPR